MKKFQVMRYLRNLRYMILIVTFLGSLGIYFYVDHNQQYIARTIINYANEMAREGIAPDGSPIKPEEIYSANIVSQSISDLGLNVGVEQIRSACSVSPVISEDEKKRKDAILDNGEEYTEFTTTYMVQFVQGKEYSKEYVRNVLDAMVKNYYTFYDKKYVDSSVIPNNTLNIDVEKYDYINCIEILDNSIREINGYIIEKEEHHPDFRSTKSGMTFSDLKREYSFIADNIVPELYAKVLGGKLTRDKEKLLRVYENRRDNDIMRIENLSGHITNERSLVEQFGNKVTKRETSIAGAIGDNTDAIIEDVEEDWWQRREEFDPTTTYDALISNYVALRSDDNDTRIDLEYCNQILEIFSGSDVVNTVNTPQVNQLVEEINKLIVELDKMYEALEITANETNEYSGARNISMVTGTYVEEAINVKLYLLLAIFLFFVIGCVGAIVIGRGADLWEYFVYTDRKTGTPNRARCDFVIEQYSKEILNENFACVALRLNSLSADNNDHGRNYGDNLLKAFGKILMRWSENYGFVGYNNGEVFIALFENCSMERAKQFETIVRKAAGDFNEMGIHGFDFICGIAESSEDHVYEVRELLKLAMSRMFK